MAGKLDTQGWIDATKNGRAYAFFVRDEILWVRRDGKYKCTLVGGNTIAAARALAGLIAGEKSGEKEYWMEEARAKKAGLPSD
jgi:hypothetical protein